MKSITYCIKTLIIAAWAISIYLTVKPNVFIVLYVLVFLIISDMTQSLIHELGHLIGGWGSGYHFLSIHFGPFEIYRKEHQKKRIAFSFNKKEVYGQCLMIPNTSNTQKYVFYNVTGVLFNGIVVFVSSIYLLFVHDISSIKFIFILSLITTGLNKIIANIIPHSKKEVPNDMMIIIWLFSSKKTKIDYFNYLRTYEKVVYGLQPESNNSIIRFNQKDINHYNPYFANSMSELAGFDASVNLTENP